MMVESGCEPDRMSAAAVLQFAAHEARQGRRCAEFGAHAYAALAFNVHGCEPDRMSAAAVLQFAAHEARQGRRCAEFGAHAYAALAFNVHAALGEMGGGSSSSSSHNMSPGWQVNDLDLDLPTELTMNEALLSLPSLAVSCFKQEAPSPTGAVLSPPRRGWPLQRAMRQDERQISNMVVDGAREPDDGCQTSPPHNGNMMNQHAGNPEAMQIQQGGNTLTAVGGYHSPNENKNQGLLMCSPAGSLDGFLHDPHRGQNQTNHADTRFQYVLAAATSIATKQNEETLTYLNQGQPYEIKLKKLGDLSHFKGKILKSVIKICFHERRLQYMEREQIAQWHAERPTERIVEWPFLPHLQHLQKIQNCIAIRICFHERRLQYMEREQIAQWHAERPTERIVEVDVPLSYGVIRVEQPSCLNALHVFWDPTKDVGVYIKVNCISTEFTAKKHGGEKGVPFRIQVETYLASDENNRLHAAACQIKVFKLKGADRKHKQDREKVMRRPRGDLEKYQPGCEATVLTTLSNDALLPPPSLVTTSPPYSPELW
ncbi:CP2 transcription factor domain-containing protein [Phthorimaea operculella]|nr:CP2 transcription factor domain-containing protein [Phthorimaea operculella]